MPTPRKRLSWDEYFMALAVQASSRSTCDRKFVGAVIVRDKTVLSTGYNGSIRGLPHCDEVGHMMEENHCVATVHAEANAIIQAAKHGIRIDGSTIYTTASPCWPCFKIIANSGIIRICFSEFYRDDRIFQYASRLGIELVHMDTTATELLQCTIEGLSHPGGAKAQGNGASGQANGAVVQAKGAAELVGGALVQANGAAELVGGAAERVEPVAQVQGASPIRSAPAEE